MEKSDNMGNLNKKYLNLRERGNVFLKKENGPTDVEKIQYWSDLDKKLSSDPVEVYKTQHRSAFIKKLDDPTDVYKNQYRGIKIKIESDPVEENKIQQKDTKIKFENDSTEKHKNQYGSTQKKKLQNDPTDAYKNQYRGIQIDKFFNVSADTRAVQRGSILIDKINLLNQNVTRLEGRSLEEQSDCHPLVFGFCFAGWLFFEIWSEHSIVAKVLTFVPYLFFSGFMIFVNLCLFIPGLVIWVISHLG
jgi:hypothetical protein